MRLPERRLMRSAARALFVLILLATMQCFVAGTGIARDCGDGDCGGGYAVVGEIVEPEPDCPDDMPDSAQCWYDPDNPPAGLGAMTWNGEVGNPYIVDTLWPQTKAVPSAYPDRIAFPEGTGWGTGWIPYTNITDGILFGTFHVLAVAPDDSDHKSRDELCETWEDGF
jgi:hypothetical protein